MSYVIAELPRTQPLPADLSVFSPRGAIAELWRYRGPEVVVCGPAETGKTWGCLQKLDALMWKYPGAQAAIVRKTYQSMHGSVLQTYRRILGENTPVRPFGGEKPEWYDYPTGSRVFVGGMDNPQKMLSSERDIIYANQLEELELNDYETLTTRCTGRGAVMPYTQILGDCNPGPITHWILQRERLHKLYSVHQDNPALYTEDGEITPQGERSLEALRALTGIRRKRLFEGAWIADVEGALWSFGTIDKHRRASAPELTRVVVGLDPEAASTEGSAETGIIVAGKGPCSCKGSLEQHYFITADRTIRGTPNVWGTNAVSAYTDANADLMVGEVNNGGDMVGAVIKGVADSMAIHVAFKKVHASRGKLTRAEPIALLYEQGKVHHVGAFPALEDQLTTWIPGDAVSPDRLDALVWALTELSKGGWGAV